MSPDASPARRVRDFGPVGQWILAAVGVLLGLGVATFVHWDAYVGQRMQILMAGEQPVLINDLPFFLSSIGAAVLLGVAFVIGWLVRSGGLDRPVLGALAASFYFDVVPGLYHLSLAMMVGMLLARGIRHGDIPFPLTPLVLPVLCVIVVYATSFLQTPKFTGMLPNFAFRSTYMLLVVLLPGVIRTRRHLEVLFHYMIAAACISVTVEWVQLGLSTVSGAPVTFTSDDYDRVDVFGVIIPRLTGLMYHPNHQSNVISTTAVLVGWFMLRPKSMISPSRRVLYAVIYVYLALGVLFTFSRSGWLSLGTVSLLMPAIRWPRAAPIYLAALGGVAFLGWISGVLEFLYETVRNLNAASADFRWHIDHLAMQAFVDHPIIGVGVGLIIDYFNAYQLEVHDTYLQAASEMGLLGLTTLAVILAMVTYRILRTLWDSPHAFDRNWAVGLILASCITLIQNMFAMFLWIRFLWAMIALLETVHMISVQQRSREEPRDVLFLPLREPQPVVSR